MKIAVLGARCFPPKHGGIEVVVSELAREFADKGHEVHVVVAEAEEFNFESVPRNMDVHVVPHLRGKHTSTISYVLASRNTVKSLNPDVLTIHGVGPAIPLGISKDYFGSIPTIVSCHGVDWQREKWSRGASAIFRALSIRALKRADYLTAVSVPCAEALASDSGLTSEVISNGVSLPQLKCPSGIEVPEKYSISVGRITPEKNLLTLVRAYDAEVAKQLGPLVVVGTGATSFASDYERSVRAVAHSSTIFTGALPREQALYLVSASSRYISSSMLEAQPLAVMEAMALGTELHLSDIEPHRALCRGGASYFAADDSVGLRRYLLNCAGTPSVRNPPVVGIDPRFEWSNVADSYLRSFSRVIQSRVAAAA